MLLSIETIKYIQPKKSNWITVFGTIINIRQILLHTDSKGQWIIIGKYIEIIGLSPPRFKMFAKQPIIQYYFKSRIENFSKLSAKKPCYSYTKMRNTRLLLPQMRPKKSLQLYHDTRC